VINMKRFLVVMMVMYFVFFNASPVILAQNVGIKDAETKGIYIEEISTNTLIYENNAQKKYYPASITKLLTALTAIDYIDLDETIVAGYEIYYISQNSSIANIKFGEKLTFLELLYGMLLPSGNDVANIVAVYTAKKLDVSLQTIDEQIAYFASLMNQKAKKIGTLNSNFVNPSGLHDDNHYTTAYDMSLIAKKFLNNDTLADIASTNIYATNNKKHTWYNCNLLLQETLENIKWANEKGLNKYYCEYAKGLKTGYTVKAGRTIVAYFEKDGMQIVAVILKSNKEDLFSDAIDSFDYVIKNYKLLSFGKAGEIIDRIEILNSVKDTAKELNITLEKNISFLAEKQTEGVTCKKTFNDTKIDLKFGKYFIKSNINNGDIIGEAIVKDKDGNQILSVNLIAENSVLQDEFYFEKYICLGILFIFIIVILFIKKKKRGKNEREII